MLAIFFLLAFYLEVNLLLVLLLMVRVDIAVDAYLMEHRENGDYTFTLISLGNCDNSPFLEMLHCKFVRCLSSDNVET